MSHFTTVQTKINNLMRLELVLKELGFAFSKAEAEELLHVKGYLGQKAKAKMVIHASKTYDIGVNVDATTGNVSFVADWEFVELTAGYNQEEFNRKIMQRYAYHTVKEEVTKRGYTLEEETTDDKQHIHIKVSSWGD
ncbi:MAG: DUF1257 domain-containing protein [Deltaproteobacteria bacterium]|nr:DUF1257 domain-containing protein [Deltaproteobacteria bacterium]